MKVTLYMAMSLNGIIAGEDGSEDFLSHEHWRTLLENLKQSPALIWGRKTYEAVCGWGGQYMAELAKARKIVISHDPAFVAAYGFTVATSPLAAMQILTEEGVNEVLLCGGPSTNTAFARTGLINEVLISIEPVLVGKGKALFTPELFDLRLQPVAQKQLKDGIIQLRYKVLKV